MGITFTAMFIFSSFFFLLSKKPVKCSCFTMELGGYFFFGSFMARFRHIASAGWISFRLYISKEELRLCKKFLKWKFGGGFWSCFPKVICMLKIIEWNAASLFTSPCLLEFFFFFSFFLSITLDIFSPWWKYSLALSCPFQSILSDFRIVPLHIILFLGPITARSGHTFEAIFFGLSLLHHFNVIVFLSAAAKFFSLHHKIFLEPYVFELAVVKRK